MPPAVILDPTAKKKKRSRIFGLKTFMDPGCPMDFFGAFRDNIQEFLRQCSDVERQPTEGMPTWCTLLVDEKTGILIPLYTVEECVRRSSHPFCDYCRCSGWSHHLVSKRNYHMIIPADDDWNKPLHNDACILHSHLLHGLLHSNGFGHLLCINGRDGGSKFVSGHQFMDLWDRLCTSLHAREVTVVDTSRKRGIDLRLLLGIAYGVPWFGRWGYQYNKGSFGVTEDVYAQQLARLQSLPLDIMVADSGIVDRGWEIRRIVSSYRKLRWSDPCASFTRLANVRDLLRYLLDLKNRRIVPSPEIALPARVPAKKTSGKRCRDFDTVATELDSRWPIRRLRVAADVIVDALAEHGEMTRQEVRDAARLSIGDTGLLDFVLKSIGNCVVGRRVVRRTSNPVTRVLEFRLEDLDLLPPAVDFDGKDGDSAEGSRLDVDGDMDLVCQALVAASPEAARAVLDGKHWVKRWPMVDDKDDRLRFLCRWEMEEMEETKEMTPGVVVVVEIHASLGDLRAEVERGIRATYCIAGSDFRVTDLEGIEGEEWDPVMTGGVESGGEVVVRGEGAEGGCGLRYQGGAWEVECACGARDDDGERMVACDGCDVWHHTRCIGVADGQPAPPLFLCARCGAAVLGEVAVGMPVGL